MSRDTVLKLPAIYASLPNCRDLSTPINPDQASLPSLFPSPAMPKLTTLCLGEEHALRIVSDPPPIPSNLNMSNISHLSLGAFTSQNIVGLLALCPALQSLSARGGRGLTAGTGLAADITLPHLEHLQVRAQFEPYLMGYQFAAPGLKTLSLVGESHRFEGCDPRKFPDLRSAILNPHALSPRIRPTTRTFVAEFLDHHPKLECLTLIPLPKFNLLADVEEDLEVQDIHPLLYEAIYTLLYPPTGGVARWQDFNTLVVHGAHFSERSPKYEDHLRQLIAVAHEVRSAMPQEICVYFPGPVSSRFLERVSDLPYNPFIEPQIAEDRDPRWVQRRLFEKTYD